jgi:hypothetical protein
MKKRLIFMALFLFIIMTSYADEQQRVKLDDGHIKEQVRLGYCNVFVTRVDTDDEGNAKVTVEIENLDETNVIILFGHAYPEKELKKLSPSITFDKNFPGTKGHRNIDTYREARNVIFIEPSEKSMLPEIQVKIGEVQLCRLPLYIAKYRDKSLLGASNGRNKMLLMEKQILELEIEVEVKPDEDYIRLEEACNNLIEDISKQTFCKHSKHRPSLKRQEAPFKERITKAQTEIDEIVNRHNWTASDRGYQRYNALKQRLDEIDFTKYEGDCGNPRNHKRDPLPARHSCKYCNSSLQQIYHKLDDYYKKIYSSSNRKATKESVIADVNLLYRCCTDGNCSKHASSWNSSDYKSKIADRYNRINNF